MVVRRTVLKAVPEQLALALSPECSGLVGGFENDAKLFGRVCSLTTW